VSVSQLQADRDGAAHKKVNLTGVVVTASGSDSPLRFVLKDDATAATVPVSYTGSVPDAFKPTRHVIVTGTMRDGIFVGQPDSLLTKCPSKYSAGGSG
jgi:cytochrome c-type biogenesis protein CcmE